jgi:16S rRNA (adenine1518-N6/adenine1519-N6)-dimethyltransferase
MSLFAKKSLGQNFLISPRITETIAHTADLKKGDCVLEIGPGKGMLTRELLKTGARVIAVEKDDRLIPILLENFARETREGRFTLIHGDILEIDLSTVITEPYKVVANIPYYITGEIFRLFLSDIKNKPTAILLMVQKEIAQRLKDTKESILSLSVKAYGSVSIVTHVSRGNFFPVPNVDSTVIHIHSIHDPFTDSVHEKRFFEIVKAGFAHKRKKLISNLSDVFEKEEILTLFKQNNISENARSEDIPLETWLALAKK